MRIMRLRTDAGPRLVTTDDGPARAVEVVDGEAIVGERLGDVDGFGTLPVVTPSKIIGIGLNYRDHAAETGGSLPESPLTFAIYPSAVIGHEDAIRIPRGVSQVDYEAELGVVVGRQARDVPIDEALSYVFAYTCVNDVSARDVQLKEGQWTRGKSFDTFSPVGPCLTTRDEIPDPQDLSIMSRVDGEIRQHSSTAQMAFSVAEIISFVSAGTTLFPGDLIATGTPSGVALEQTDPDWLTPGVTVEVEIESIGILRNNVIGSDND
ncbi:MAG TPA: fumarylacetoacetate hydrolase family protein [Acidimicrobiia bacterium]|nr:fumarylacetoacetate hydrolase family protein [Acidimicrobiia bacterium]